MVVNDFVKSNVYTTPGFRSRLFLNSTTRWGQVAPKQCAGYEGRFISHEDLYPVGDLKVVFKTHIGIRCIK